MKTAASVIILFANAQADSSPSDFSCFENVVTNACESAPSANKSRKRLGIRNASWKQSKAAPAPKIEVNIISRASPNTRLAITAALTFQVAFADISEKGKAQMIVRRRIKKS